MGCPCDNYACDLPEKKAVFALYSGSSKPSVLIQPNGECFLRGSQIILSLGGTTENFEFKINDDTEVYYSCSSLLNGELFVFGGSSTSNNQRKQVRFQTSFIWASSFLSRSRKSLAAN